MTDRQELQTAFDALLQPERFEDYCPNGLQVEGCGTVRKIVSGVTASLALIEAAIAHEADTIFVHHGLFWRGHDGRVTGWMRQRLGRLLEHIINLFARHLALDDLPELGNSAQLGWARRIWRAATTLRNAMARLRWRGTSPPSWVLNTCSLTLTTRPDSRLSTVCTWQTFR